MFAVRYFTMRRLVSLIAIVISTVAVVGWAWAAQVKKRQNMQEALLAAAQSQVILVHAIPTQVKAMPQTISALGSLYATQKVTLSSQVAGRVQNVYFKDGQRVEKGMPILQLDNAQAQADYDKAVTKLKQDTKHYERAKQIGTEAYSQEDIENMQAAIKNDAADVEAKQAALNEKTITAPFAGMLGDFQALPGDYISAGQAIVILVNGDQMRVKYSLPENNLPKLQKGQQVAVTVAAYKNRVFYGTVTYISPSIDENTRTVALEALIPNPKHLLSSGMFVHCAQQIGVAQNALVVPLSALQAGIKGYSVYKVENGVAVLTLVKLGTRQSGMVQVLSGLKQGDLVVTDGAQKLQNGSPVRVIANTNTASNFTNSIVV